MGFMTPDAPEPKPLKLPEPEDDQQGEERTDPDALKSARERAKEAKKRQNRQKLRIPLDTKAKTQSGLQLPSD